ncbi:MAG: DmsE family decaheme c-type cytochrome [Elusimicrobia bacterium]|nr:DmsE family decaheme c-type cytochrome [Elusimicrobiota bacterium]
MEKKIGGALAAIVGALVLCLWGTARAADAPTYVGASTCISCHADKGDSFKASQHGHKLPVVKGIDFEHSCESCHGPGSAHAAAGGDKNDPGFATIKDPLKMAPADVNKLCLSCHKQQEVMYWNIGPHAANGLSCINCHSVHDGHGPKNLKVKNDNEFMAETETCLKCHKTKKIGMNLPSHHPVLEGKMSCASCHNPHGGESGNIRAASVPELCAKCHAEKLGPFAYEHPPVTENCLLCHDPHGSVNDRLLKQRQPYLCLQCHKFPHTGTTNNANAYTSSTLPLQRGRCVNCHREIHGSDRHMRFIPH